MSAPPDVSVVVPTFNAARTLPRALDSALAQSHRDIEVIVVDDASHDTTVADAKRYAADDTRIKVFAMPSNRGPAAARNYGFAQARGRWIALLDADDAWHPDRLQHLLALARAEMADVVFDNLLGFDAVAERATGPLFSSLPPRIDLLAMIGPVAAGTWDYGYLKPLMRTAFVHDAGLRYDEALRTSEDLLFYLELLALRPKTAATSKALYTYTTPVTGSGEASPHSHSKPADRQVAARLRRFITAHTATLNDAERAALQARADLLMKLAPLSDFYDARRRRQRVRMMGLFLGSSNVQREIARKLWQRL